MVQGYCIYPFLTSAIYVNYKPGRAKEREYKVWTMVFFLQIWLWPLTYKLCQRSLYILYQKVLCEWIMSQVCMAKGREYMAWTMILNKIKIMEIFMHTYTSNTSNLGFVQDLYFSDEGYLVSRAVPHIDTCCCHTFCENTEPFVRNIICCKPVHWLLSFLYEFIYRYIGSVNDKISCHEPESITGKSLSNVVRFESCFL